MQIKMNLVSKQSKLTRCEICGRVLTDPESVALRIGPECAARHQMGLASVAEARSRLAVGGGGYAADQLRQALHTYDRLVAIAEKQRGWRANIEDRLRRDLLQAQARIAQLKANLKLQMRPASMAQTQTYQEAA